jgi:hypothetical protein
MSKENKEIDATKAIFYSDCHKLKKLTDELFIEDCRYKIFTELLDNSDIYRNPIICRAKGKYKTSNWSIIGYAYDSLIITEENDDNDEDNQDDIQEQTWTYTLFNGTFSDCREITNTTKTQIQQFINESVKFIEATFTGNLVEDISDVRDLQLELINLKKINKLNAIDICILTDGILNTDLLEETIIEIKSININCNLYYWDLKKWNDLKRSKSKRLPIDISFTNPRYSFYKINYIEQKANELSYILAIFPGDLLSDLYDYHKIKLLENNVRVFLSANRAANKAIRDTIKKYPERFFSFNNGISATASSVKFLDDKISEINDFQIVNGGQTTASIHYASKKDKSSLNNVYVQVKITSLRKDENYSNIVSSIAKAANTQTAIRSSDFYTNDPFLIEIERLSEKTPFVDNKGNYIYYYFERMTGQYNVTKNNNGTDKGIKIWESSHPKEFVYNKIDITRWYNCFNLEPHVSALSAEKQFTIFMDNNLQKSISLNDFKSIIGFGLLFKRARKVCGTKTSKEYPSIIGDSSVGMATTIYAMSYLQYISEGLIDYHAIYNNKYNVCSSLMSSNKRINSDFDEIIEILLIACWDQIAIYGGTSAQEKTKDKKCWEFVKDKIKLSPKTILLIDKYKLSINEIEFRKLSSLSEEEIYFNTIEDLLKENAKQLNILNDITLTIDDYKKDRALLNNFVKRVNDKKSELTLSKVKDITNFKMSIINNKIDINTRNTIDKCDIKVISFIYMYDNIFKNKDSFIKKVDNLILDNIDTENIILVDKLEHLKSLIDKFYIYPGLSIEDFELVESICKITKLY